MELVDWSARPETGNVPTGEGGAGNPILADGCAMRLLTVCNLLLAGVHPEGSAEPSAKSALLPSEIEMRVFHGLTGDSRAAGVFRAGLGVGAALARDAASRVAEAVGRGLRGQPDLDFCRAYETAFARGRAKRKACPWRCCREAA